VSSAAELTPVRRDRQEPDGFAIVGAALFVKGALAQFLRFWMARMVYEQQIRDGGDSFR